jgi:hypothetical protein
MIPISARSFNLLVLALLSITLCGLFGECALVFYGKQPPESISNLAHVALGGLVGLFVVPGHEHPEGSDNPDPEQAGKTS